MSRIENPLRAIEIPPNLEVPPDQRVELLKSMAHLGSAINHLDLPRLPQLVPFIDRVTNELIHDRHVPTKEKQEARVEAAIAKTLLSGDVDIALNSFAQVGDLRGDVSRYYSQEDIAEYFAQAGLGHEALGILQHALDTEGQLRGLFSYHELEAELLRCHDQVEVAFLACRASLDMAVMYEPQYVASSNLIGDLFQHVWRQKKVAEAEAVFKLIDEIRDGMYRVDARAECVGVMAMTLGKDAQSIALEMYDEFKAVSSGKSPQEKRLYYQWVSIHLVPVLAAAGLVGQAREVMANQIETFLEIPIDERNKDEGGYHYTGDKQHLAESLACLPQTTLSEELKPLLATFSAEWKEQVINILINFDNLEAAGELIDTYFAWRSNINYEDRVGDWFKWSMKSTRRLLEKNLQRPKEKQIPPQTLQKWITKAYLACLTDIAEDSFPFFENDSEDIFAVLSVGAQTLPHFADVLRESAPNGSTVAIICETFVTAVSSDAPLFGDQLINVCKEAIELYGSENRIVVEPVNEADEETDDEISTKKEDAIVTVAIGALLQLIKIRKDANQAEFIIGFLHTDQLTSRKRIPRLVESLHQDDKYKQILPALKVKMREYEQKYDGILQDRLEIALALKNLGDDQMCATEMQELVDLVFGSNDPRVISKNLTRFGYGIGNYTHEKVEPWKSLSTFWWQPHDLAITHQKYE